uniref:Uncharacterized protein n=1 Tax=Physcomitrium patens TaxID=3218 RepID=A0A2K1J7J3_PHYPA|nr:hypothetical protein PHYPA_020609 [Physcomitrium patens]
MGVSICMLSTSVYPLHQCGFLLTTWDTFGLAIPENFHGGKILYLFFVQLLYVSSTSSLLRSVSFVSPHDVELNMRCSERNNRQFQGFVQPASQVVVGVICSFQVKFLPVTAYCLPLRMLSLPWF